jgi:hypothetical protein
MVTGGASPDDRALTDYWARTNPPHSASCTPTARVGKPPAVQRRGQLLNLPASLRGLLEPCAWKAGTHGSEGAPAR